MLYGISIVIITIIIATVIIISFRFSFFFFGRASVSSSVLSCHVIFVCPSGMFVYRKTKDYHLCPFYCTPFLPHPNFYNAIIRVQCECHYVWNNIFHSTIYVFSLLFCNTNKTIVVCVCVCVSFSGSTSVRIVSRIIDYIFTAIEQMRCYH